MNTRLKFKLKKSIRKSGKRIPKSFKNYVDLDSISIKTSYYPVNWIVSTTHLVASISLGNAVISIKDKELFIHSFGGTRQLYSDIKKDSNTIKKLKQKVEDLHNAQLRSNSIFINNEIKVK